MPNVDELNALHGEMAFEVAEAFDRHFNIINGDAFCPDPDHERHTIRSLVDFVTWSADHLECTPVDGA